nr:hypothetical protein [Tanacetum cinerariifolium]
KPQKKQKPKKSKQKDTQETQPSDPTVKALNEENVPAQSNDPPLSRVNTLRSKENRLKLQELMELCTKLSERVLNLETTKTAKAKEISSLKRRVKRLGKKKKSRTHGLKRLYKVGLSARVESSAKKQSLDEEDASKQGRNIADIDMMKRLLLKKQLLLKKLILLKTTLVNETKEDQGRYNDQEMFDTRVLYDEEVVVENAVAVKEVDNAQNQVSVATTTVAKDLTVDDITLAKALEALKTSKPKIRGIVVRDHKEPSESTIIPTSIDDSTRPNAKGIVMEEPSEATTTTIPIPSNLQDKGKGIIVEPEMPFKRNAQISLHKAFAFKLQAEEDEQERIIREKAQQIEETN